MAKVNWDKVAEKQFNEMPQSFKEDWGELRGVVYGNKH